MRLYSTEGGFARREGAPAWRGVNAEVLAAVNTDPEAPIFEHADYGIVQDCGAFLEEALAALQ